jgi:DivIVA domain-containing protein
VLAVIAALAAVAAGVVRGGLPEATGSLPEAGLAPGVPDEEVDAEDVSAVRFSLGLRGYRMSEVDEVLDRLTAVLAEREKSLAEQEATVRRQAAELAQRDADISRLQGA